MLNRVKTYAVLLRTKHYIKNILIFFPLFFGQKIANIFLLNRAFWGMVAFCCISSSIYIENDIMDVERDRLHPVKKFRAIASGQVSTKYARKIELFLLIFASVILVFLHVSVVVYVCYIAYFLLNLFYSHGGKNIPIADIFILSVGYPIRILIGGGITGTPISCWMFLTILCISLYLAIGKRTGEIKKVALQTKNNTTRPVLDKYNKAFLEGHLYLCMGLGIMFYSLWTIEKSETLVYSVPLIMLICIQYNFTLYNSADGDPVETLF